MIVIHGMVVVGHGHVIFSHMVLDIHQIVLSLSRRWPRTIELLGTCNEHNIDKNHLKIKLKQKPLFHIISSHNIVIVGHGHMVIDHSDTVYGHIIMVFGHTVLDIPQIIFNTQSSVA